jgi:DNA replication protein DnaC
MGDTPAATAILDRCLQSAEIIEFKGRSYRLKTRQVVVGESSAESVEAN